MKLKYYVNLLLFIIFPLNLKSQEILRRYPPLKYISQVKDLSKYYRYANGGFDADWYIGYNNTWIIKLPPINKDGIIKAYIGSKIGREKSDENLEPIQGKIYIGISQKPSFSSDSNYFLVDTQEIPREPLINENIENITSSKWFWTNIPLSKISSEKDNYLAIWAVNDYLNSSKNSPIIAAAYQEDSQEDVWLNKSTKGSYPYGENSLETIIKGIKPAIVIKLIPQNQYKVVIKNAYAELENDKILISFSVIGVDIEKAWIELSYDKFAWTKITNYMFSAPFFITLDRNNISKDMFYLRVVANDNYENIGYSNEIKIPPAVDFKIQNEYLSTDTLKENLTDENINTETNIEFKNE